MEKNLFDNETGNVQMTPDNTCGFVGKETEVINVDGKEVTAQNAEFVNANILGVTVGSNGLKGGDSGHGSRTIIRLKNECSTDWDCKVKRDETGCVTEIEIVLGGDSELCTMINALEYSAKALRANFQDEPIEE